MMKIKQNKIYIVLYSSCVILTRVASCYLVLSRVVLVLCCVVLVFSRVVLCCARVVSPCVMLLLV